jgi:hypothetical protein
LSKVPYNNAKFQQPQQQQQQQRLAIAGRQQQQCSKAVPRTKLSSAFSDVSLSLSDFSH